MFAYSFLFGALFIIIMILIVYPITKGNYTYIEPLNNNQTENQLYADIINQDISNNVIPIDDKTKELITYDTNNYNVTYHESPENLEKDFGYGLGMNTAFVFDSSANKFITINVPKNQTSHLYNSPGYYKYGNDNYVPSYEESVLLSSQTNYQNKKSEYKDSNIEFKPYFKYEILNATYSL